MKTEASLLSQFEELPELREKMKSGSDKEIADAKNRIDDLLALEGVVDNIDLSMNDQRKLRASLGVTKDIRPISDRMREEHVATKLRHIIPFFAMRAFSLPVDYREPKESPWTKKMYHDFIDAIVIQPEYLPDDFLVSLGLMTEEEKKSLSLWANIEKKIDLIPAIKALLHSLIPLWIWERKTTGRLSRVGDSTHPNFGWYIVFQELPGIQWDTETTPRNLKRKVVPHYYKDHYSLMRSQSYALNKLRKRIEFLTELRDATIPEMLSRWQSNDYSREDKQTDIALLTGYLRRKRGFLERRALEDRIKKIDFSNPERDRQRLNWACNDIIKGINDTLGKIHEIASQSEWLRDSERQVRSAFELFYDEVIGQIPRMNESLEGVNPQNMWEEEDLKGEQAHVLNQFEKTVQRFHEKISNLPEIGNPFHNLRWIIEYFLTALKQHRSERKKAIGKVWLRLILALILEFKQIRYEVMIQETEYRQKIRWDKLSLREKAQLQSKLESVLHSIEHERLLPQVELTQSGKTKFEEMIKRLESEIEQFK
jgi:hypothetical protein